MMFRYALKPTPVPFPSIDEDFIMVFSMLMISEVAFTLYQYQLKIVVKGCHNAILCIVMLCPLDSKCTLSQEGVEEMLGSLDGVTTVHAPFYDQSSRYHQVQYAYMQLVMV